MHRLRLLKAAVIAAPVLGIASAASAQVTPETLPAATFPVTMASIGEVVAVAGGAGLLVYFGVMIAFRIIRKTTARATAAT